MSLERALFFALPIVVGAVIGLFTNWLAIKMLFRPLKEYRVFGMRIPFTPGILPRERARIAQSLGQTVADDLLTKDAVLKRLMSPDFKQGLEHAVLRALSALSSAQPSMLGSAIGTELGAVVRDLARGAFTTLAQSQAFSDSVEKAVTKALDCVQPMALLPFAQSDTINALSASVAARITGDTQARIAIADTLSAGIASALAKELSESTTIASLFGPEALPQLARALSDSLYKPACDALLDALSKDPIRATLESAAAGLLRRALDRFNAFQRFFISLGQYDKAILENVPAVVGDFLESMKAMLAKDSTRIGLSASVLGFVRTLADKPITSFAVFAGSSGDQHAKPVEQVLHELLSPLILSAVAGIREDSLSSFLAQAAGEKTVGDLLALAPEAKAAIARSVSGWLSGMLGGHAQNETQVLHAVLASTAQQFYESMTGAIAQQSIGSLLGVQTESLAALAHQLAGPLAELAARESANILDTLNIKAMVISKIEELDMIEVERLLLRVIDKELAAVTWFGALLGALIGLLQSLLSLIR